MANKLVFLKTDQDFAQFRQSKQVTSKNFRLRFRYNTNQNIPRFGFIISKKVLSRVTERNRIKRRLKNILQNNFGAIKPVDYLVFPQKSALKLGFVEISAEFIDLFKKAKLWKL